MCFIEQSSYGKQSSAGRIDGNGSGATVLRILMSRVAVRLMERGRKRRTSRDTKARRVEGVVKQEHERRKEGWRHVWYSGGKE